MAPIPVYAASAAGAPPMDNSAMDTVAGSPINGGLEHLDSSLAPPEMRYGPAGHKRGWVLKKGKFLDRDGMFFMHRKNRLLVLDGAKLSCYKKEDDDAPEYDISLPHAKIEGDRAHLDITVALPHRSETYHVENPAEYDDWLRLLVSASKSSIKDYYALVAVLGEGHFGRVLLAKDRRTFERFAVKVIRKSRTQTRSQLHIQRELEILRQVNHHNVVRLYDLFDTEEKIYIVLEYMPGGALFSIIAEHKTFSEQHAASIMRDILHGLAYLHARNIVHRDLKPDNLLCTSNTWPFNVKLADFGLSNMLQDDGDKLMSKVGTPLYCSPEVLTADSYDEKVDLWAAGVLLYELLTGVRPFNSSHTRTVINMIIEGRMSYPDALWSHISPEAQHAVKWLLTRDPAVRPSAAQALTHPWIAGTCGGSMAETPIKNDLSTLRNARGPPPLGTAGTANLTASGPYGYGDSHMHAQAAAAAMATAQAQYDAAVQAEHVAAMQQVSQQQVAAQQHAAAATAAGGYPMQPPHMRPPQ
ncbi:hypothetical protein MMPV_005269 [Pyropia vietnamensis]